MKKALLGLMTACAAVPAVETMAQGESCENPIVVAKGTFTSIKKDVPTWYQVEYAWPCTMEVNEVGAMGVNTDITSVAAKSKDCNAVANESSALLPNSVRVKGGTNLIRVVASKDIPYLNFTMSMAAGPTASCGNRPERTNALTLDKEEQYQNDVYENYWRFIATEDGSYVVTNKAAEGTIFKVGVLDEDDSGKFICNFEDESKVLTIDASNEGKIQVDMKAGEQVIICSDTYAKLASGRPSIGVVKGTLGIQHAEAGSSKEIAVSANPSNGNFQVSSYLLKEGASVNVYDMSGKKVYGSTLQPTDGTCTVQMNGVPSGTYLLLVIGQSKSASTKIIIE